MARSLAAILGTLALAAAAGGQDPRTELDLMQGAWQPSRVEMNGEALPIGEFKDLRLAIKGEEYTVTVAGQTDRGTIKLDVKKKPKGMDILGVEGPNKGKTVLAIYDVAPDSLTVCYALDGKRPDGFQTAAGDKRFLVKYAKVK